MYGTQCVLALLALYAGMGHSFPWEIVIVVGNRLEFYDSQGALTHTENITANAIYFMTYDPVHERVLFVDTNDDTFISSINSFEISTKKVESLVINTTYAFSLTYDPATELLFWTENGMHMYSISIKPGYNNTVNERNLVLSEDSNLIRYIAVDSCGGFIYWVTFYDGFIYRARFNGSEREVVKNDTAYGSFTIDQQTQTMYWDTDDFFECADFNGKNIRTMREKSQEMRRDLLTASKDVLYYRAKFEDENKNYIRTIPKNPLRNTDVESKLFIEHEEQIWAIAANYNIEDLTRGLQNCEALKSLLPNKSVTNANDSLKVSTDVSLLCVHGAKVSGEDRCECTQGYSGDRCDAPVCQNYCFQGDCSASAEGQPKCRCNAGYSGQRCEVNACHRYCLNNGVCSLNENSEPVCQCTGDNQGERCEVPGILNKCLKTVSMLRDILKTDVTPPTLGNRVKSTCTVV